MVLTYGKQYVNPPDFIGDRFMNRPGIVGDPKLWDNTVMKNKQYRAEVKTRAVELLIESQKDYPSLWAAIQAIAPEQHAAQGLHTWNLTFMASKALS